VGSEQTIPTVLFSNFQGKCAKFCDKNQDASV